MKDKPMKIAITGKGGSGKTMPTALITKLLELGIEDVADSLHIPRKNIECL